MASKKFLALALFTACSPFASDNQSSENEKKDDAGIAANVAATATDGSTSGEDGSSSSSDSGSSSLADASEGGSSTSDAGSTCTLVTHDNKLGQSWQDCAPLGTHDETEALRACAAWCAGHGCTCYTGNVCTFGGPTAIGHDAVYSTVYAWAYAGVYPGSVISVELNGSNTCTVGSTWE